MARAAARAGAAEPALQRRRPRTSGSSPTATAARRRGRRRGRPAANVVDPAWAAVDWTLGARGTHGALLVARSSPSSPASSPGTRCRSTRRSTSSTSASLPTSRRSRSASSASPASPARSGSATSPTGSGASGSGRSSASGYRHLLRVLLLMREHPTPALLYAMVARTGPARLRPRVGLRRHPRRALPGQALRHDLRHPQPRGGAGAASALGHRRPLRPHRQLRARVLARHRLQLVSMVCIWLAAPRKVRAVAGRILTR